ncbi:putative cysteine desulfurase [Arenibacter antarcticus]|uniref:Aminotransferase class V-fold PLP-dependent enzyme n=1 Tax=Arenibacter antarcticus TaxID=2040469 RepID=A0ABW5VDH0_9FLAO|nr:aminotransferase class V-fold PLP-dependent enzyme [Arenibacter sp. H213]MCM4169479.1 aminotransferase [Arenibacter sp. H213]
MKNIIKQFPVLNQYCYADTATSGLLYDGLLDWRQEHDLDVLIGGRKLSSKLGKIVSETRNTVSKFFSCKSENVALTPNFSIGINLLLEGLGKKEKVLLLKGDYPSVNWPFESRDFSISYVDISADLEEHIFNKIKSDKITLLALSLVQWLNGVKIDVEFLKTLKKEYPDLIIIADGTQFCGTESINFDTSGIDVLGASGYKWLLGGSGNGFMLFSDTVAGRFNCPTIGFNAARGNLDGKDAVSFSNRFEPGHLDSMAFGSLNYSLKFLSEIGMDVISEQIKLLSNKALSEFGNLGLLESYIIDRNVHSSIFNIAGGDKEYSKLMQNDVLCAQRGGGIRLAFHFYNTENEIDRIVKILK